MNNKIKTLIFKYLSLFPREIGNYLYHKIQNKNQANNLNLKLISAKDTFNELEKLCSFLKIDLKEKTILEIGSGWVPSLPYLFLYKSFAKKIITYDINKHYQEHNLKNFNELFESKYNVLLNVDEKNLPLEVEYIPNCNVSDCKDQSVDVVFSRFVFEHVPTEEIKNIHQKFQLNLKKGTYIIHFISPSDHRAYTDKTLTLQDFLKYSKKEWDKIQTRFDYHNRLRFSEYLNIFKELNIEIVYQNYILPDKKSSQYQLFKKLTLHEDYENFTEEDLVAGNIIIILKL